MSKIKNQLLSATVAASMLVPNAQANSQNTTSNPKVQEDIAEVLTESNSLEELGGKTISLEDVRFLINKTKEGEIIEDLISYYGEQEFKTRTNNLLKEIEGSSRYEELINALKDNQYKGYGMINKETEEHLKTIEEELGLENLLYKHYGEFFVNKGENTAKVAGTVAGVAIAIFVIENILILSYKERDQRKNKDIKN